MHAAFFGRSCSAIGSRIRSDAVFAVRFDLDTSCPKEPEQQAWKQQVLNREIELEEIDTAPYRDRYGPNSVQVTRAQAAE